jgi:hypothetical protein
MEIEASPLAACGGLQQAQEVSPGLTAGAFPRRVADSTWKLPVSRYAADRVNAVAVRSWSIALESEG